jgi:hypothetical protein
MRRYSSVENIVALEDAGIRAYVPLPDMNHRRPFYGQDEFTYDAARDAYHCPAGHTLRRERIKHTEGVIIYRADAATCNACPLKAKCTESNRGRIVHRSLYADFLDKVPAYHATEAYKKRCASGRCGSSRYLPRLSSGMAYAASGDEGSRTSISRGC